MGEEKEHVSPQGYFNFMFQEPIAASGSCVGHTNQSSRFGTKCFGKRRHPMSQDE